MADGGGYRFAGVWKSSVRGTTPSRILLCIRRRTSAVRHHSRSHPFPLPPLPRIDHIRIPVGPGELHAERYGFGDHPLVLLHGFGTSTFLWRQVAPALPLGRVTAWAIDLLGHGESDRPVEGSYGIAAQALAVEQAMTSLRIGRATVVGVDFGAAVALRLAATRPARVHGIVLISPPPAGRGRGEDLTELGRLTAMHLFEATRGMLGAAAWLGPLLARGVATPEAMPTKLIARYAAPFVGAEGVRHLQLLANAVTDADMEDVELGRITARALVLRGEHDVWCSSAEATRLATAIRGAEVRSMATAGRLIPEDAPEALAALLADWAAPVHAEQPTRSLPPLGT